MNFKKYWQAMSAKEKVAVARKLRTTVEYVGHIAHGHSKAGAKILANIEFATDNHITVADLRPDLLE